jgi:hypothetical protein
LFANLVSLGIGCELAGLESRQEFAPSLGLSIERTGRPSSARRHKLAHAFFRKSSRFGLARDVLRDRACSLGPGVSIDGSSGPA